MAEDPPSEPSPPANRCRDRGSASLQVVLLTPVLVVLMFAGWQAALWNHARTNARVIARETAVLVARDRLPIGQAVTAAKASLANTDLDAPDVDIVNDGERVTVQGAEVDGAERERLWARLNEQLSDYAKYQEKVRRRIAVVELRPI